MNYYSYCLVLLVSAASIWNTSAHPRYTLGGNAAVTKVNAVSISKGHDIHDEVVSPSTATKEDAKIGGRKMAVQDKVMKLEKDGKVVVDGVSGKNRNSKTALGSSSNLEAKIPCGSHDQVKSIGIVECKQSSSSGSRLDSEKGGEDHEYAGFVAFSQDYHSPRHHPPKNN